MSKNAKPDAWMPLYIGDWDGDTGHLTCEQDGAYGRLVRHYWRNGPLADDDRSLACIVRKDLAGWRRLRPVLVTFFTVEDGVWRHKRVDAEVVIWGEKRRRHIERASAGGLAKAAKSRPQALLAGCSSASARAEEGPGSPSSRSGRAAGAGGRGAAPPRAWSGPGEIRDAVVGLMGEAYARSWLDPAGWRETPERAVVCRLEIIAERLARDLRGLLAEHGVAVLTERAA